MSDKKQKRVIRSAGLDASISEEEAARAARIVRERRLSSPNPLRGADPSSAPRLVRKKSSGGGKERQE